MSTEQRPKIVIVEVDLDDNLRIEVEQFGANEGLHRADAVRKLIRRGLVISLMMKADLERPDDPAL
jgi:hypothetical protein